MDKFISYAQNCEDVILWRALKNVGNGRYMDIGANHPVQDSVTKAFYDRGWSGVNVEPIRTLYDQLKTARPRDINLCCAVSSQRGKTEFFEIGQASGLSTIDRSVADVHAQAGFTVNSYEVPVDTVAGICGRHNIYELHFLKIDVEGAELSVLQGASFDHLKPWIIVIEATRPNTQIPSHEAWEPLLNSNGYTCVYFDGANRYYLSQSHGELAPVFGVPPSVFDNFFQYSVYQQLVDELTLVRKEAEAYRGRLTEIRASLSWKLTRPLRAIQYIVTIASGLLKGFFHG